MRKAFATSSWRIINKHQAERLRRSETAKSLRVHALQQGDHRQDVATGNSVAASKRRTSRSEARYRAASPGALAPTTPNQAKREGSSSKSWMGSNSVEGEHERDRVLLRIAISKASDATAKRQARLDERMKQVYAEAPGAFHEFRKQLLVQGNTAVSRPGAG